MPRKAKDKIDENEIIDEKKAVAKKTSTVKKKTTKKDSASVKKSTKTKTVKDTEKTNSKAKALKDTTKKTAKTTATKKVEKKTSTRSKATKGTEKDTSSKTAKKTTKAKSDSTPTKKNTTQKSTTKTKAEKKSASKPVAKRKKTNTKIEQPPIQIVEYYDLPYKYGNTVVRLLAQTPKTLFVYWEVSDADIENFKKTYGDDFFIKTKPILVVHNTTLNKTTEIEINDFANCWYLNIEDSDCKYDIELARKYIEDTSNPENIKDGYLSIATSNDLQSPNNHILFEKIQEFIVFKDVNNDEVVTKKINSFDFLRDIYKFYKNMYDEDVLNNPSSQFKF